MALFLDSANVEEAQRARDLGFIVGVTTNPALAAKAGRPALDLVRDLAGLADWLVFHQLTGGTKESLLREAETATGIAPDRIVLKIMVSLSNLELVASRGDLRWAVTGVASAAQGLLAAEAGAEFVIPYVNRITRADGDGVQVVAEMATLLEGAGASSQILAASLKTPQEVVHTLLAGADHVTLPWALLEEMARHPVTDAADEDFRKAMGASS